MNNFIILVLATVSTLLSNSNGVIMSRETFDEFTKVTEAAASGKDGSFDEFVSYFTKDAKFCGSGKCQSLVCKRRKLIVYVRCL